MQGSVSYLEFQVIPGSRQWLLYETNHHMVSPSTSENVMMLMLMMMMRVAAVLLVVAAALKSAECTSGSKRMLVGTKEDLEPT